MNTAFKALPGNDGTNSNYTLSNDDFKICLYSEGTQQMVANI